MDQETQDAWMRSATPNEHHARLHELVGEWEARATFWMEPGASPIQSDGACINESILGGRWINMRYTCDFMGMPYEGTGVFGFDNLAGEYVGNWLDSMCTQMMVHRGKPGSNAARIEMRGTSRDPKGVEAPTRNLTTIHSKDRHTYEMFRTPPGKPEFRSGIIEYTRRT